MSIVMCGMPPAYSGRWPEPFPTGLPMEPLPKGGLILPQPAPTVPEGAEAVQARIEARVKWLENELRMHAAWTDELEMLKRMLAAVPRQSEEAKP